MPMTPENAVRAWFDDIWNKGQEDAIHRLADPHMVAHGAPSFHGPDEFRALYRQFRGALPDIQVSIGQTVTNGEYCAAHCHVTGRHTGDGLGPATNRAVAFDGLVLVRVRDGRLVEAWNCFDFLSMYQQVGWIANPPQP